MAIKYPTALRTTRITAVLTAIDVGASAPTPATLTFYGGTPFVDTTALAVLPLNYPCGTVTNGVLNFDVDPVLTGTGTAAATSSGTNATWARIKTSAGATVVDMTAGQTGDTADIILTNKLIVTSGEVSITSASIADGNS